MRRAQTAAPSPELKFVTSRKSWSRNTAESFLLSPESAGAGLGSPLGFADGFWPSCPSPPFTLVMRNCVGPSSVARLGHVEVGSVEIIFPSYADEREQSVAPRIGERRPHAFRARQVIEWAN